MVCLLVFAAKMHDPSFTIGVEINGEQFTGTAVSKKKAKQLAAEKALQSFLAMPDSIEATKIKESGALDFTSDNIDANMSSQYDYFLNTQNYADIFMQSCCKNAHCSILTAFMNSSH